MCLAIVALDAAPRFPLIVAANRDERHERPTDRAGWWPGDPPVFGGRDRVAGGTWLAVDRLGRFAAVTNVRDGPPPAAPRSRGTLVADFLRGTETPAAYAARVHADAAYYNAFNLLLYDGRELHRVSHRASPVKLAPGVHVVSNAPFGVDWPKMDSGRAGMERLLDRGNPVEALLEMLGERYIGATDEDRYRRSHFIVGPTYGTRCSTVVLRGADGTLTFVERSFDALGRPTGEVRETFFVTTS